MKQIKETDYLYASGRIRALEGLLLNRERSSRMIGARTLEDALRVLTECGYGASPLRTLNELERMLDNERSRVFDTMAAILPDPRLVDVFRARYDTHNIKVLLKASASSEAVGPLLLDCGRVRAERLTLLLREMTLKELPPLMGKAVEEARDILARTGDPQLMDISLDTACLKDMLTTALGTGIPFLTGYVRLIIDAANLRTFVRVKRMGKAPVLLQHALSTGGSIPLNNLTPETSDALLESLYAGTLFKDAAMAGAAALREDLSPTELDRRCENALTAYLHPVHSMAFGPPLAVAYLAAKESEITAVRTILSGRLAGLPPEGIHERIRDHYV